jgi:hypothetical protein
MKTLDILAVALYSNPRDTDSDTHINTHDRVLYNALFNVNNIL